MKLITVDIGSFNIKTSEGIILENRFELDNNAETFGGEVLSFDGNNYFFGKGEFNKTFSKAHKEIEVPLFYALSKSNVSGEVNLILHLPASQMAMKNLIVDRLQGHEFTYKVNGVEYKTIFNIEKKNVITVRSILLLSIIFLISFNSNFTIKLPTTNTSRKIRIFGKYFSLKEFSAEIKSKSFILSPFNNMF